MPSLEGSSRQKMHTPSATWATRRAAGSQNERSRTQRNSSRQILASLAGPLECLVKASDEVLHIEGLGQESNTSGFFGASPSLFIAKGGHEDDWDFVPIGNQTVLQVRPADSGHLNVA